jgi:hypothetical protein
MGIGQAAKEHYRPNPCSGDQILPRSFASILSKQQYVKDKKAFSRHKYLFLKFH